MQRGINQSRWRRNRNAVVWKKKHGVFEAVYKKGKTNILYDLLQIKLGEFLTCEMPSVVGTCVYVCLALARRL